ncbi:hypothetical protein JW935_24815 [candidate division KSB1 bacterium]|nr:hypothetical protein [candidate division KSB1 bacterium]
MSDETTVRIQTFMSPVYHRCPACPQKGAKGTLKEFPNERHQTYLFDDLLGGGIVVPGGMAAALRRQKGYLAPTQPGLCMLVSGPPGSGKSTFALELCYRLASNHSAVAGFFESNPERPATGSGLSSVYLSAEARTEDIIDQCASYGWDPPDPQDTQPKRPKRVVSRLDKQCESTVGGQVYVLGKEALPIPKSESGNGKAPETDNIRKYFADPLVQKGLNLADPSSRCACCRPSVVVFDSLNVLPESWPSDVVLEAIRSSFLAGPIILVLILDVNREESSDRWQFFSDLTIQMSYMQEEDYLVRKIQIVKARYQDHADGVHRLKINPKPSKEETVKHPMSPFIKEGGIFVFPSVHRYLSTARKGAGLRGVSLPAEPVATPFKALNDIIQGRSFPRGSCTAIVGSRGGMKSHLAYYTLLNFLKRQEKERALMISLRDQEEPAKDTLAQILAKQRNDEGQRLHADITSPKQAKEKIEEYLNDDRLEILYFYPGYISPEEFLHLVGVAVDRRPVEQNPVSLVVVNGLEQLSARFPLCAREKMFVSGLITFLCVRGTTNIVVSGGEAGAPPDSGGVPAGLLQMADLVIESSFRLLPKNRVWSESVWPHSKKWLPVLREKQYQPQPGVPDEEPHVVYQIIREPGARECRKRTLFYMGREEDEKARNENAMFFEGSVHVTGLPDDFPYGTRL